MLIPASRLALRQAPRLRTLHSHRLLSTAPPHQTSRSWRNSAVRWGIAIGGLYYYNNTSVFAEEPPFSLSLAHPTTAEETSYPTFDSIAPARQPKTSSTESLVSQTPAPTTITAETPIDAIGDPLPAGLDETEEEASQQGAFNEETGEINWDCPCLGGMAHGPCGEAFRAAFSCFVYSKEEPKGMDCIDNFSGIVADQVAENRGMQDCFRLHPDVYGDELADPGPPEEDDEPAIAGAVDAAVDGIADVPASANPPLTSSLSSTSESSPRTPPPETLSTSTPRDADIHPAPDGGAGATEQVKESEELVPKEWHDARQKS
ncbi:MAG: hypothetical protein Q9195_002989 [Heterodermia aff. obscurata]